MGKYDCITKYINEIKATDYFGDNDVYPPELEGIVRRFSNDFLSFAYGKSKDKSEVRSPGFDFHGYSDIPEKMAESLGCDIKDLMSGRILADAETTLSLLMWIERRDSFGGGLGSELLSAFMDGRILKWLEHLKLLETNKA